MAVSTTATQSQLSVQFSERVDLLVSLHLWSWHALTFAIQNAWGGSPQISADKREGFAGAVSELLTSQPPQLADADDLEEVLMQFMNDEFELVVDDESAQEIAHKIWRDVKKVKAGDTSDLDILYQNWQEKQKKGGQKTINIVRAEDRDGDETDWDDEDDEDEWKGFTDPGDRMDVDSASLASTPAPLKPKIAPEVDEDGFTKVMGRKRR